MFCSRACSLKAANVKNVESIKERFNKYRQVGSKSDKYSPFRSYLRSATRRFKECDLDLEYLYKIWELQKGMCPYTNLKMNLRIHTYRNKKNNINLHQASLDRIDSTKGYIKGNVEFICLGINYLKSSFSKEQVINFLIDFKNSTFIEDWTISSPSLVLDAVGSP